MHVIEIELKGDRMFLLMSECVDGLIIGSGTTPDTIKITSEVHIADGIHTVSDYISYYGGYIVRACNQ